jgi:hypothetical protein
MDIDRISPTRSLGSYRAGLCLMCALATIMSAAFSPLSEAASPSTRIDLYPRLQAGQVLTYEIAYRSDKQTKTKSSLTFAQSPGGINTNVRTLVRIEILGVAAQGKRSIVRARASFTPLDPETSKIIVPADRSSVANPQSIEFSILPDGRIDQAKGLDAISADQQEAWQQWTSRFVAAAVFPRDGIKPAQKWKSDEPERSASPIAGLLWLRDSTYVRNEPCRPLRIDSQGNFVDSDRPADTCAVILTNAQLKQQSSANDATPEDFRVRQLRTSGMARGANKTVLYISLRTGIVVRSSDQADQSMSVTIAKTDGSNQVHYDISAKSSSELFLISTN